MYHDGFANQNARIALSLNDSVFNNKDYYYSFKIYDGKYCVFDNENKLSVR